MNNEVINFLIKQLSLLATTVVRVLRFNEYQVKIRNYPKTQEVKGTVIVGNQKRLEDLNRESSKRLEQRIQELKTELKILIPKDFPKEIKVTNIKETPQAKFSAPEVVSIKNISQITDKIDEITKEIRKLELNPEINLPAPKVTVTPTPVQVSENVIEIEKPLKTLAQDLTRVLEAFKDENPKKYIPVRLSDGKAFYKAIEDFSIATGNIKAFSDSAGTGKPARVDTYRRAIVYSDEYRLNDRKTVGDTKYLGFEDRFGNWYLMRIMGTGIDPDDQQFRFATNTNNDTITTYTGAWNNKETLTYSRYSVALPID